MLWCRRCTVSPVREEEDGKGRRWPPVRVGARRRRGERAGALGLGRLKPPG